MADFFGRRARLRVQRTGQPISPNDPGFATQIEGLHLSFKIEKTLVAVPNNSEISIINLSAANRRQMEGTGLSIILEAGYEAAGRALFGQIFKGDTRSVDHTRVGPDWVTKIQAGDGERAYQFAQATDQGKVGISRAAGVSFVEVAETLARSIKDFDPQNIDISGFLSALSGGKIQGFVPNFVNGYATQGNAMAELEKLMASSGYQLSVQDGALQALKTSPTEAQVTARSETQPVYVLNAGTGLVGSPEHGSPDKNGLPPVLKAKSLILPDLKPGDRVRLDAEFKKGDFRIEKLKHLGDLAGRDWYTDMELRPV